MDAAAKAVATAVAQLRDRWPILATVVQQGGPAPEAWAALPPPELLLRLVRAALARQLRHPERRGARDPRRWEVASRLVVDAILRDAGIPVPGRGSVSASVSGSGSGSVSGSVSHGGSDSEPDTVSVSEPWRWEGEAVEGVYERLGAQVGQGPGEGAATADVAGAGPPQGLAEGEARGDEERWRQALARARAPRRGGFGVLPGDTSRPVERLPAHLDWRVVLWRFIARTPTDFGGFDRRFVGRGLYLDALEEESLRVFVAVDTSSSIALPTLARFVAEIEAIAGAYPHVRAALFYADSALHGPHELRRGAPLPPPIGGGGTDFRPFFAAVEEARDPGEPVLVYLTDGDGTFPSAAPRHPTLWVRPPGGRPIDAFPFGRVVPLLDG